MEVALTIISLFIVTEFLLFHVIHLQPILFIFFDKSFLVAQYILVWPEKYFLNKLEPLYQPRHNQVIKHF